MDGIQFNSKFGRGGVQNPIMQKCGFLLLFTVFSGGRWIMRGGPYIYIYVYTLTNPAPENLSFKP